MEPGERRDKHCGLAKLNTSGRCIALCFYNSKSFCECDCTGKLKANDDVDAGLEQHINKGRR